MNVCLLTSDSISPTADIFFETKSSANSGVIHPVPFDLHTLADQKEKKHGIYQKKKTEQKNKKERKEQMQTKNRNSMKKNKKKQRRNKKTDEG